MLSKSLFIGCVSVGPHRSGRGWHFVLGLGPYNTLQLGVHVASVFQGSFPQHFLIGVVLGLCMGKGQIMFFAQLRSNCGRNVGSVLSALGFSMVVLQVSCSVLCGLHMVSRSQDLAQIAQASCQGAGRIVAGVLLTGATPHPRLKHVFQPDVCGRVPQSMSRRVVYYFRSVLWMGASRVADYLPVCSMVDWPDFSISRFAICVWPEMLHNMTRSDFYHFLDAARCRGEFLLRFERFWFADPAWDPFRCYLWSGWFCLPAPIRA